MKNPPTVYALADTPAAYALARIKLRDQANELARLRDALAAAPERPRRNELAAELSRILWPLDEPEKEWTPETLDAIAAALTREGYGPPAEKSTAQRALDLFKRFFWTPPQVHTMTPTPLKPCEGCGARPGEPCDPFGTCDTESDPAASDRYAEARRRDPEANR